MQSSLHPKAVMKVQHRRVATDRSSTRISFSNAMLGLCFFFSYFKHEICDFGQSLTVKLNLYMLLMLHSCYVVKFMYLAVK